VEKWLAAAAGKKAKINNMTDWKRPPFLQA
jgi:hypothetical protein